MCSIPTGTKLRSNLRQVVHTYVCLSPSSITWYWAKDGDVLRLRKCPQAWQKVMTVDCRRVYMPYVCGINIRSTLWLWEQKIASCSMGSHSVTCHPAAVTFPPLPQSELGLDLATLQLSGWYLYPKIVYPQKTVISLKDNQAVAGNRTRNRW